MLLPTGAGSSAEVGETFENLLRHLVNMVNMAATVSYREPGERETVNCQNFR